MDKDEILKELDKMIDEHKYAWSLAGQEYCQALIDFKERIIEG